MLAPRRRARRGTIAPMAALGMTVILGFVALSVDAGMLLDRRRQLQAAADAASLAGAGELYQNAKPGTSGPSPTAVAAAVAAARAVAAANGYTDGAANAAVTVNCPPQNGAVASRSDKADCVEVTVAFDHPRYFSTIFGTGRVPVAARSASLGRREEVKNAIIVLDPKEPQALEANGGGVFTVAGAPVQVNSVNAGAMNVNGGTLILAPKFTISGNPGFVTVGRGTITGTVVPSSPQIPDPLRFLPEPNPAELVNRSPDQQATRITKGNETLDPGVYTGGIAIGGQADVTLRPGIYYMAGGGFSVTAGAKLAGEGVMIFNAPGGNNDKVDITGGGSVTLTPPTSGIYQGITIFQKRSADVEVKVAGGGGFQMAGALYAANAPIKITGGGALDVIGGQYISRTLTVNGNAGGSVVWTAKDTPGTRQLQLVE